MRHFYFRLIIGIILLIAAVVGVINANSFAALYFVLCIVFLWSAYSIRKKEKKDRDNRR